MARQKGLIKLKGTLGDITFYKSQDGYIAREKTGIDGSRIATDPAFVRTRENGAEFGSSAASGKLVRSALRTLLMTAKDGRVTGRLMKVMTVIKNMDATSVRGKRNVGVAIVLAPAKALLKGFNFNSRANLGSIFFRPYALNTPTGVITINGLVPSSDVIAPPGATHMSIKGCWAKLDFSTNVSDVKLSNVVNVPLNGTSSNVVLTPSAAPTGTGTNIYALQIEFFQMVNTIQYSLKNGEYNSLSIIDVV
ncbi:MAG: hypothetical protein K0S26_943 [Bacteroidota bacterium]|jgi:hypothetical protein|nr:hypothetical protein [Bacteroidota bacterium]